jgi:hypothetical protein
VKKTETIRQESYFRKTQDSGKFVRAGLFAMKKGKLNNRESQGDLEVSHHFIHLEG